MIDFLSSFRVLHFKVSAEVMVKKLKEIEFTFTFDFLLTEQYKSFLAIFYNIFSEKFYSNDEIIVFRFI